MDAQWELRNLKHALAHTERELAEFDSRSSEESAAYWQGWLRESAHMLALAVRRAQEGADAYEQVMADNWLGQEDADAFDRGEGPEAVTTEAF